MSQPRSAGEIAEHIERPVPTATGHLRAMMERGLVRRIAFGTYALADYTGPEVRIPQRRSQSTREMRSTIRAYLDDRCSVQGLHLRTGIPEKAVRVTLRDLWFRGCSKEMRRAATAWSNTYDNPDARREYKDAVRKTTA